MLSQAMQCLLNVGVPHLIISREVSLRITYWGDGEGLSPGISPQSNDCLRYPLIITLSLFLNLIIESETYCLLEDFHLIIFYELMKSR